MSTACVYIFGERDSELVKVGHSRMPHERCIVLRSKERMPNAHLLYAFELPSKLEALACEKRVHVILHEHLARKQEWFSVSPARAYQAVHQALIEAGLPLIRRKPYPMTPARIAAFDRHAKARS